MQLIHLKIWHIFRKNLAIAGLGQKDRKTASRRGKQQGESNDSENSNENDEEFSIDLSSTSEIELEDLRAEYERFLEKCEESWHYKVLIEGEYKLEYSAEKSLASEFDNFSRQTKQQRVSLVLLTDCQEKLGLNLYSTIKSKWASSQQSSRYQLTDCLDLFTSREILEKGNEWYCSKCKQHQQAMKQMEIFQSPKILVVHMKRFRTSRVSSIGSYYYQSGGQKIEDFIDFPIRGLELKNYVLAHQYKCEAEAATATTNENSLLYDLFAVSNHYGTMSGGHYTAFAMNPKTNKWYDFNDSSVSQISESEIVTKAAYVLFYRKRDRQSVKGVNAS